mgnify:CR=1 FL=1
MRFLYPIIVCIAVFSLYAIAQPDSGAQAADVKPSQLSPSAQEPESATLKLSLRIGYGVRTGGTRYVGAVNDESEWYGADTILARTKDHYMNYGEGMKVEAAAAIALMEHLDAEFAIEFTGKTPRTVIVFDMPGTSWKEKYRQASYGAKLILVPRFRVVELIDMEIGCGAGIFFTTCTMSNTRTVSNGGYVRTRPGFVFCARLGAELPVADRISITAAIVTEQVSYTLKEYRRTDSPDMYTAERNRSSTSAYVVRPEKIPGSNAALHIGTRFIVF